MVNHDARALSFRINGGIRKCYPRSRRRKSYIVALHGIDLRYRIYDLRSEVYPANDTVRFYGLLPRLSSLRARKSLR